MNNNQSKYDIVNINTLKIEHDNEPYILIDRSGSTDGLYNFTEEITNSKNQPQNIIGMERILAYETLKKLNIKKAKILFWNTSCEWIEIDNKPCNDAVDIEYLLTNTIKSSNGTQLAQALEYLTFDQSKQINDVYIFTDGEIQDVESYLSKELQRLFQYNVKIHIHTVENNNSNYTDANCDIGNKLFTSIRNMKMTNNIYEFVLHNQCHGLNGFKNYYNPTIPSDCVLFRNNIIHKCNIVGLIKILVDLDLNKMTDNELKLVIYELSNIIHQITKNKNASICNEIISLICKAFINTKVHNTIYDTLTNDIVNIKSGGIQTYHEYRNAKTNRNEKAQLSIFENVKKSISPNKSSFISFPITTNNNDNVLFIVDDKDVNENLLVRNKIFNNGCFKYQNHTIPILPIAINNLNNTDTISCIRRWVFSVYFQSKQHCNSEDMVLYQFLTDMLCIYVSDIPDNIKQIYVELAKIMLKEIRDNTEITEYDYLLTNKPSLVYGGEKAYHNLMKRCRDSNGIKNITISTLWYGILLAINDTRLLKFHKQYLLTGLEYDSKRNNAFEFNCNNDNEILTYIKSQISKKYIIKQLNNISNDTEYTCYITLESTTTTGGYKINSHEIAPNICCNPKYIIKKEIFESLQDEYKTCPICYKDLSDPNDNMYTYVLPFENKKDVIKENIIINEPMFECNKHNIIAIPTDMVNNIDDNTLLDIDTLDFATNSYEFDKPTINDTLNARRIAITNTKDFKTMMEYRYPFIEKMSFKNIIIAGGFCRSILLKQRAKDIDFFFHNDDNSKIETNEDYIRIFRNSLNELTTSIYDHYNNIDKELEGKFKENAYKHNIKFMAMFKPLYNVFEVICIKDPKNFIGSNEFNLKYFDKYKFNSLNTLNKHVQINVKKNTITTDDKNFIDNELNDITKNMLSNYFEDNDISGISMLHRFQFILCKYNSKLDVLNSFDMYPSRVCYDGNKVYMTQKAHFAYKYMINVLTEKGYSNMFDTRISKYFSYGFSIVLPLLDIDKIPEPKNRIVLNNLKFNIHNINRNNITVEHDSNLEDKLKSNAILERHCKNQGISLYKSAMFCSLVSVCRYVEANNINYIFTNKPFESITNNNLEFKFYNENIETNFVDHIVSRIYNYDWYKNLRKIENNDIQQTFYEKIDTALNAIDNLPISGKIVIYGSDKVNGYCNVFKVIDDKSSNLAIGIKDTPGIVFTGPSSKLLAKLYMEKNKQYISLTQELNPITGTRQFICRKSIDKINLDYAYEILLENKYYKPYLDIEWLFECVDDLNAYNEEKFLDQLRIDIIEIFKDEYKISIKCEDILVLSSSADNLKSYHVIINANINGKGEALGKTLVFENNVRDKENSAYSLCYYLMKKSSDYITKLDWRVYSIDREFRMPYAYKSPLDKRRMTIIPYKNSPILNLESYLITSYNDIEIIKCDKIINNEFIEKKKSQKKITRTIPESLPKVLPISNSKYIDPMNNTDNNDEK